MHRLPETLYLAFPFRVTPAGPRTSGRRDHVREQIEQLLFTDPGERVFRPQFGAGARRLVFEPNSSALSELTRKRLSAALMDAVQGEVDPRTLEVDVRPDEERLQIVVSYQLATISAAESHVVAVATEPADG